MAKAGRKPKSRAQKEMEGNLGRRPLPPEEPVFSADGIEAPEMVLADPIAKKEWNRMAPQLVNLGLLTNADVTHFAVYCSAWSAWVNAEATLEKMATNDPATRGRLIQYTKGKEVILRANPMIKIAKDAAETMMRAGQQFGMGPASRTKVGEGNASGGKKEDPTNPYSRFKHKPMDQPRH